MSEEIKEVPTVPQIPNVIPPRTLVDDAKDVSQSLAKQIAELKMEREKLEVIKANELLGGRSLAGTVPVPPVDPNKEIVNKVLKMGGYKPVA